MIYLRRDKPHKLEVIEVLLKRGLADDKTKLYLEEQYMRTSLGYEGECYADKYWGDLRLSIPYALFHSFETKQYNRFHHQIDTIFVCQQFILLVELKFIAGEINYDEAANQLWRNHHGQHLVLGDPFAQISRHELLMSHFLLEISLDIPIITAVIVTAKSAILRQMPQQFHIFKIDGLGLKLKNWLEKYPVVISEQQLELLKNELLLRHHPKRWNWQQTFPELKILDGVLCSCGKKMVYMQGKFFCSCGKRYKNAMYEALNDYRILYNEWITNGELRKFLGINSPDTALKLLKRVSDAEIGQNKGRKYRLSEKYLRAKRRNL